MISVLLIISSFLGFSGRLALANSGEFQVIEHEGFVFAYRVREKLIDIKVSCETDGWVGVGFDPDEKMQGANIVIGFVSADGAHLRDSVGTKKGKQEGDVDLGGTDDVQDATGTEVNGRTELSFTYPMDPKDSFDKPIALGESHRVMLACGKQGKDDFTTKHEKATLIEVRL